MSTSGYVPCKCRDCIETAIANDMSEGAFCWACEEAGCPHWQGIEGHPQECQAERPEHEPTEGDSR